MRVHIDPEKLKRAAGGEQAHKTYYNGNTEGRGGRPGFEPQQWQRDLVSNLIGMGVTQAHVARLVGIGLQTMRYYMSDDIELGKAQAHSIVAGKLFECVKAGQPWAIQFFMRTQMGWAETKAGSQDELDADLTKLTDEQLNAELAELEALQRASSTARGLAARMP